MDFQNAWNVAVKDFKIYRKKPNVIYASVAIPIVAGLVFPFIVNYALHNNNHPLAAAAAPKVIDAFSIFFLIGAVIIPTAIASYSLVGEKISRSLEPLLATPMTDGEILLGKTISCLLLPVAAMYMGSVVFMGLVDYFTQSVLGYLYLTNSNFAVILLCVPLVSLLSVEVNIIISSRLTDARSAQQLGMLTALPFLGLYFASEQGFFTFNDTNLLTLAAALVVINCVLFFTAKATFKREEILTKWR